MPGKTARPNVAVPSFRALLRRWYESARRDLPWRRTRDPYRIWLSEIMLQQTRVAAALPYYERFLARFPDVRSLARAPEADVLAAWAGLGYYSRARNLRKAARAIDEAGAFPSAYEAIRALPGVGDYTAAAIASIAFGLPHPVLDGNVLRVLSRVTADSGDIASSAAKKRLAEMAGALLDARSPGDFNQALMELGATVCLPRDPQCLVCPVASLCLALRRGLQHRLPVKSRGAGPVRLEQKLLLIRNASCYLLWQRPASASRMAGFWELPEAADLPDAVPGPALGRFRHSITNHHYTVTVHAAEVAGTPQGFTWLAESHFTGLPLSTTARKALRFA